MVVLAEEIAASLVREYLSRKGLKRTMACLDEEHPRTSTSINSRSDLREVLHMEDLCRTNKAQGSPLKSMLEIMVRFYIDGHNDTRTNINSDIQRSLSAPQSLHTRKDLPSQPDSNKITSRYLTEVDCPAQDAPLSLATDRRSTLAPLSQISPGKKQDRPPLSVPSQDSDRTVNKGFPGGAVSPMEMNHKKSVSRVRRGMMAGPRLSSTEDSKRKHQTLKVGVVLPQSGADEDCRKTGDEQELTHRRETPIRSSTAASQDSWITREVESKAAEGSRLEKVQKNIQKDYRTKLKPNRNVDNLEETEMILDDIDDDEELLELSRVTLQSRIPQHSYDSYPMDQNTASALKEVLLGSSTCCFSAEWKSQSFAFSEITDLRYGIIQNKGGPCGVLASMQAYVLKKLLFEGANIDTGLQRLRPSNTSRTESLVLASAEVLWRAGGGRRATVAVTSGKNHFIPSGQYRSDGIFEKITCFTVDNMTDLQLLLEEHIHQFESGTLGCILLTISVILSRSIDRVREDMDVPTTTLIGAYGYCTQELVNLFLCGRAVSNVFDNDMELDSGNGNLTLLRGVQGRCDVGLLSLFEHYNICKVGSYLKTPRFPVWLVCSESHFSVVFALQRELLASQVPEFDLYYYDGLANQQEEIRLTVSVGTSAPPSVPEDAELVPPLEHCIRTRWSDAAVNWNHTEPIL